MKKISFFALIAVWLLFGVLAASAGQFSVSLAEKEGIGTYLTDGDGITLYWFKKDTPGKSECMGSCVDRWPVFYGAEISTPPELDPEDFGTITREDGEMQSTFKGFPLYYWLGDRAAGDTTGNMVGNVWFVVDPKAFPPVQ